MLQGLTEDEKRGQKTPLCKTPVSEMLQFAAQLLPNNPPVVPPSATHVDVLQSQLQAGLGMSPMMHPSPYSGCYQAKAAYPTPPVEFEYQYPPQDQLAYSYEEYPSHEYPYSPAPPPEGYSAGEVYTPQYQSVHMEFQFPPPALPNTSYPPPVTPTMPDAVYTPRFQQPYPPVMQQQMESVGTPLTPFTPNTANMSVLGKQMAEMVLATPARSSTVPNGKGYPMGEGKSPTLVLAKTPAQSRRDSLTIVSKANPGGQVQGIERFEIIQSRARSSTPTPRFIPPPNLLKSANSSSSLPAIGMKVKLEHSSSTASLPCNLRSEALVEKGLCKWGSEGSQLSEGGDADGTIRVEEEDARREAVSVKTTKDEVMKPPVTSSVTQFNPGAPQPTNIEQAMVINEPDKALVYTSPVQSQSTKAEAVASLRNLQSSMAPSTKATGHTPEVSPIRPILQPAMATTPLSIPPNLTRSPRRPINNISGSPRAGSTYGSLAGSSPGSGSSNPGSPGLRGSPRKSRIAAKFRIPIDPGEQGGDN